MLNRFFDWLVYWWPHRVLDHRLFWWWFMAAWVCGMAFAAWRNGVN